MFEKSKEENKMGGCYMSHSDCEAERKTREIRKREEEEAKSIESVKIFEKFSTWFDKSFSN